MLSIGLLLLSAAASLDDGYTALFTDRNNTVESTCVSFQPLLSLPNGSFIIPSLGQFGMGSMVLQGALDAYGKLKPGADNVWLTKIKWERIKSSAKANTTGQPPKPDEKEMLRERCEGTIIDLLDEFEKHVMPKYPFHRQTLIIQRQADQQRDDNLPPLVLDVDSDHSENGTIANAREIQSEYWRMNYFSLFISIWSYLCSEAWLDRSGALHKGDAVTFEPEGASVPGSLELVPGSVYAEVEVGSSTDGEDVMYAPT